VSFTRIERPAGVIHNGVTFGVKLVRTILFGFVLDGATVNFNVLSQLLQVHNYREYRLKKTAPDPTKDIIFLIYFSYLYIFSY